VRAPPERLDDPDPLRGLLDLRREVAELVLHAPGRREVPPREPLAHHEQRHRARAHEKTQRPVQMQQQRDNRHVHRGVDHQEDEPERQEPPDHRKIAGHPRKQLAGLPPVVERDRQPLQVRVQVAAQCGLHTDRGRGLGPAADEDQRGLRQTEREREQAEQHEPARVAVPDRAVDDPLRHEGYEDDRARRAARSGQQPGHLPEVRADVAPDPPQVVQPMLGASGRGVARRHISKLPTRSSHPPVVFGICRS
jgi:hypothetical protein